MPRRIASLLCLVLIAHNAAAAAGNVVLLVSDNQNQSDCGCHGNQTVQTRNRE